MKDYYIDEKGNKRRLRLNLEVGDIVILQNPETKLLYPSRIIGDYYGRIGVDCLLCTTRIYSLEYQSIQHINDYYKDLIKDGMILKKIIRQKEIRQMVIDAAADPDAKLINCTWQDVIGPGMRELHALTKNPKLPVKNSSGYRINLMDAKPSKEKKEVFNSKKRGSFGKEEVVEGPFANLPIVCIDYD